MESMNDELKINVLIVDDVDYIRMSLSKVLSNNGCVCDVANNGTQAIEKVKNNTYDLIITDIMMPDTDGYEFMDFIRSQPSPVGNTPILAISGGDKTINSDLALKVIQDKANDILQKPFSKTELINAVAKVVGKQKMGV